VKEVTHVLPDIELGSVGSIVQHYDVLDLLYLILGQHMII
jgi:hypothetical protein